MTSRGLNRFTPSTGIFKKYTISNGLPDDHVLNMEMDKEGKIWLVYTNKIFSFDPISETIVLIGQSTEWSPIVFQFQ
ncbi:MAG: hypothetical protein IPO92_13815 [Saprospiraceae bacterium]|nr:hypothetical protein [Saprospiraceae bacterium]